MSGEFRQAAHIFNLGYSMRSTWPGRNPHDGLPTAGTAQPFLDSPCVGIRAGPRHGALRLKRLTQSGKRTSGWWPCLSVAGLGPSQHPASLSWACVCLSDVVCSRIKRKQKKRIEAAGSIDVPLTGESDAREAPLVPAAAGADGLPANPHPGESHHFSAPS